MIRQILSFLACVSLLSAADAPVSATPPAPAKPPEQPIEPPVPGRFKALFQPFRTDQAALSPDGKYLAYTVREGEVLSVVVLDIDHPGTAKARVQVIDDNSATPMLAQNQAEKTPARINWMKWVTASRLVVETNKIFARRPDAAGEWQSWRGAVVGFDADGANAKQLAAPDDLPEFAGDAGSNAAFSSRRRNNPGFDSRVTTPDQPTPPPDAANTPATNADTALLSPEDTQAAPLPNYGATQPRTLRVFDLDPSRPGAITLVATGAPRGNGNHSLGFFSLDTQTGKLTSLTDDLLLDSKTALLDRQGHIRLTLPNTTLTKFPFHYDYQAVKSLGRPHPLDEITGLTGFTVTPENYFGSRAIPLGFDENPNLLYYAANLGRDTYGIYSIDLATKQRGALAMENPAYDLIGPPNGSFPDASTLVFDRYQHQLTGIRYDNALRTTAWVRPEWKGLQAQFEKMFPGRCVEITDWDEAGNRFLLNTEGPADPGAFFIFDRTTNKLSEFARRAPWVDTHHVHVTLPFSYPAKDGSRVSGLVTVPQQPRLKPIPMVVLCPDQPWQRVHADFQTEVQALADMGFVVVQLNGRGAWGLGLKQREALTAGYDLVQIDDLATTIGNLGKIFNVNPGRVAVMGRGHGGFIALRAVQAHPEQFRCAIALDAPVNLGDWLAEQKWSSDEVQPQLMRTWLGDDARFKAAPLTRQPATVTKPILMLNYPGPDGTPRRPTYAAARHFAGEVRSHGVVAEFDDLSTDYMNGLPAARAAVYDRIEAFLNEHVYDYKVKLHELEIIK